MKLLYCNICNDLIQLRNDLRGCFCGCQIGRYLDDNHTVEIASKYIDDGKLIGVTQRFLTRGASHDPLEDGGYFAKQNSCITVIPWNSGDSDVVYGDWDAMRATLLDNTRAELFGELTDPEVANDRIRGAFAGRGDVDYADGAAIVGCGVSHLEKLMQVLYLDDSETFEKIRAENKRAGVSK